MAHSKTALAASLLALLALVTLAPTAASQTNPNCVTSGAWAVCVYGYREELYAPAVTNDGTIACLNDFCPWVGWTYLGTIHDVPCYRVMHNGQEILWSCP